MKKRLDSNICITQKKIHFTLLDDSDLKTKNEIKRFSCYY
jgi:hypothetical protein